MGSATKPSTRRSYNVSVTIRSAILTLLLAFAPAWAEPPATQPADAGEPAAEPVTRQAVAEIISQLGSETYATREQAQQQLRALPPKAMPWIAAAHHRSTDPEIRMRIERYAKWYFEQHVLLDHARRQGWPAFLGITTEQGVTDAGEPSIRAATVLPDTAAAAAGLKDGDNIVAFNGQAIPPVDAVVHFSATIRQMGIGSPIQLTVQREQEQVNLTARLGIFPLDQLPEAQKLSLETEAEQLRTLWWEQAFLKGRATLPTPLPAATSTGIGPDPTGR